MLSLKCSRKFPSSPMKWTLVVAENWFACWVNNRVLKDQVPSWLAVVWYLESRQGLSVCLLLHVCFHGFKYCFFVRVIFACNCQRQCRVSRVSCDGSTESCSQRGMGLLVRLALRERSSLARSGEPAALGISSRKQILLISSSLELDSNWII